jgi:hypothetical protein
MGFFAFLILGLLAVGGALAVRPVYGVTTGRRSRA